MRLAGLAEHLVDAVLDEKDHLHRRAAAAELLEGHAAHLTSPRGLAGEDLERVVMPIKTNETGITFGLVSAHLAV